LDRILTQRSFENKGFVDDTLVRTLFVPYRVIDSKILFAAHSRLC
jgi:hypothetical protein